MQLNTYNVPVQQQQEYSSNGISVRKNQTIGNVPNVKPYTQNSSVVYANKPNQINQVNTVNSYNYSS